MDSQAIAELITILTAKVDNVQQGVNQAIDNLKQYQESGTEANSKVSEGFNLTSVTSLLAAAGIAFSATKLAEYLVEATEAAAKTEEMQAAMKAVGGAFGTTNVAIQQAIDGVKQLGITDEASTQLVSYLERSHLDLGKAVQLAQVAMNIAAISGQNYDETIEQLGRSVEMGNTRLLRQAGLASNANLIYSEYAATLGKTSAQLTDQERRQATLNAILEQGAKLAGANAAALGTTGGQLSQMGEEWDVLKEHIGSILSSALNPILHVFNLILEVMGNIAGWSGWRTIGSFLGNIISQTYKLEGILVGSAITVVLQLVMNLLQGIKSALDLISNIPGFKQIDSSLGNIITKMNSWNQSLISAMGNTKNLKTSMEEAATSTKKMGDGINSIGPSLDSLIRKFEDLKVSQNDFANNTMPAILQKVDEYMKMEGLSYSQQVQYLKDLDMKYQLSYDQRAQLAQHIAQLQIKYQEQVAADYQKVMTQSATQVTTAISQEFTGMVGDFQGKTVDLNSIWEQLVNKMVQEFISSGLLDLLSLIPGLGSLASPGGGLAGGLANLLFGGGGGGGGGQAFGPPVPSGYFGSVFNGHSNNPSSQTSSQTVINNNLTYNDQTQSLISTNDKRAQARQVADLMVKFGYMAAP